MIQFAFLKKSYQFIEGKKDICAIIALLIIALVIRLVAARTAHPACGDALHFIEHGWQLAQGDLHGLSNYWSQGQILMAAFAFFIGLDPQRTLQGVTIISGVLVTVLLYLVARRLDETRPIALIASMLVAMNPFLINLSITGYSEMPYLASWLLGTVFMLDSRRGLWSWFTSIVAGLGFGASIYFRMTDALVLIFFTLAFYVALEGYIRENRLISSILRLLVCCLTILVLLIPLSYHSRVISGRWIPSSSKIHTIVLGDDVYNSKWMYGLDVDYPWKQREAVYKEKGFLGYLWIYRDDVSRRLVKNLAQIVRLTASNLFPGPVRLGPASFLAFVSACIWGALWRKSWKVIIFASILLFVHSIVLSLYFIFPRYLVTTTLFVSLIIAAGVGRLLEMKFSRGLGIFVLVSSIYCVVVLRTATHAFQLEFMWYRYGRLMDVADDIATIIKSQDVFMAQGASIIAQRLKIYDTSRYLEVPYEDMDTIAEVCKQRGIRYVVASDVARPHWPIGEAVRNRGNLKPPWRVIREWQFDGIPWVNPPETVVLLEYVPSSGIGNS